MNQTSTRGTQHLPTSGFSLLEVTVSIFILSIVLLAFCGSMKMFQSDIKRSQLVTSRSDIVSSIRINLTDLASLYNSGAQPMNSELEGCLNGTAGCLHTAGTGHLDIKEMNLYGSILSEPAKNTDGSPKLDVSGNQIYMPEPIGGISSVTCPSDPNAPFPVFYTKDGRRCACSEDPAICPLQAITQYQIFCAKATPTCATPAAVKIMYSVQSRSDLPESATKIGALSQQSGSFLVNMTDLVDAQQVRFSAASSYYNASVTTSSKVIESNLTDFDISQGKVLSFSKSPSYFTLNAYFTSATPVSTVVLSHYVYPLGCNVTNLGNEAANVDGATVDCSLPIASKFTDFQTYTLTTPQKNLGVLFNDTTSNTLMIEYRLQTKDAGGTILATSTTNLRASFKDGDSLQVLSYPNPVRKACASGSTYNTFTIKANAFSGWQSITATLDTQLSYDDGTGSTVQSYSLPNFGSFDLTSSAPQDIVVDYKYFASVAGAFITLHLEGITNDGNLVKTDQKFQVAKPPLETMTILNPANGSSVRTTKQLPVSVQMNLDCDDDPTTNLGLMVKIQENGSGTVLLSPADISDSCVPTTGGVDQNLFVCTHTYDCKDWLNVADNTLCVSKYSADTDLKISANYTSELGTALSSTSVFKAGTKISIYLAKESVKFYLINTPSGANITVAPPTSIPIRVQLSSALDPGETGQFKLVNSGGTSIDINCTNSGLTGVAYSYPAASSANYYNSGGSFSCTTSIPTPSSSTVLSLTTSTTSILDASGGGNPTAVTVASIPAASLTCDMQPGHPICPTGQTLKANYTKFGAYDYAMIEDSTFPWITTTYQLLGLPAGSPVATMDALLYYRPLLTSNPDFSLVASQKTALTSDPTAYSENKYYFPSASTQSCSSDSKSCPGDVVWFPSIDNDKIRATFGSTLFTLESPNKPAGTATTTLQTAARSMVLVRQCYCQ